MTIRIIDYQTRQQMKNGHELQNRQGFRTKHIDFINNDESQGYHVTYTNDAEIISNAREYELSKKIRDSSLTLSEINEWIRGS